MHVNKLSGGIGVLFIGDRTAGGLLGSYYLSLMYSYQLKLSKKFGIKLQAQVLSATRAGGGDIYYGYWGPYTVPDYTTIWQFGLGGGLTYKIK